MGSEDKKYSLISVDTGMAEEEAGVRTSRETVDGEETIVVSSGAPADTASDLDRLGRPRTDRVRSEADRAAFVGSSDPSPDDDADEDDRIPFQRMQGIIIVCLIALIVAFLVYFNFIQVG